MRRRAVVFLLSDFIIPEYDSKEESVQELFLKELSTTRSKHDLVCCQVFDKIEIEIPRVGRVCFEDAETGEIILINTSNKTFQKQYQENALTTQDTLVRQMRRRGIDNFQFSTDSDYAKALQGFFQTRVNRRGR